MNGGYTKFGFSSVPFFLTNGPHNQYVLIDMTGTIIFRQGLPGKCLYKSVEKHRDPPPARYRQFSTLLQGQFPGSP